MSHFLVDCGNTRLKWAEAAPGVWRTGACDLPQADLAPMLDTQWGSVPVPQRAVICCVGGEARRQALVQWMQARWTLTPAIFQSAARTLDNVNHYRDPTSLGADRWAALLGARALVPGAACVVDCGTAVTVDALSAKGEFQGGVILPGIRLLRAALTQGTSGVKQSDGSEASCLGRSTADAVAGGTYYGLLGAIERCVREQQIALGETVTVFLTGGDAERVAAELALQIRLVPDLVLRGLARYAESLS
ncbi:MAG: type III pantothenate kinase [Pseudomonadota bacterium]|nr:MAG: type III pantothenate kinase [Pseudomonadota bacterium]